MDAPLKEFYEESMDMLEPIEKEKSLREDITGEMSEQLEMQKELSQDVGEGAAFRTGEYTPPVGGVTGGVAGVGRVGVTGAATSGGTASSSATGGDGAMGLLQGILDATRLTAINTGRAQTAVLG